MEFGVRLYNFKVVALVHGSNGISIVSMDVFCSYYILYIDGRPYLFIKEN